MLVIRPIEQKDFAGLKTCAIESGTGIQITPNSVLAGTSFTNLSRLATSHTTVTTTFADYLMPGATEVPRIEVTCAEFPSPLNPLGVKGVGESGCVPAAAAIVSAIESALAPFGVRIGEYPDRDAVRVVDRERGSNLGRDD